ncbi:MAG: hypothetical protein N2517_07130 [Ignavibacteria bacterium]|nr:hypothetical protein [Ignavibacteria bacterium]
MQNKVRRRRIVEIYFILYLAALIFILPESSFEPAKNNGQEVVGDFASGFTLIPEKTSLLCKVAVEPNGNKIISFLDSSNVIFYTGDFEDIQFEFIVEDQASNQSVSLRPDKNYNLKYFRVIEVPEKRAAIFYWRPQILERMSNTYLVRVEATARSKKAFGEKFPEKFTYKASTQFTLLVVLMNAETGEQVLAQESGKPSIFPFNLLDKTEEIPTGFSVGKVSISPAIINVSQIAYQQWTNTIRATNVNLSSDAKINLNIKPQPPNNGGTAQIAEIYPDYLLLRGKTPSNGKLLVEVSIVRKFDGQEAKTSFTVTPQQIEKPIYAESIYPGQSVTIDPRFPLIPGESKLILKEGERIRASSLGGAPLTFTPELADTGKRLTIERYIDNNLLGQTYFLYIQNFPYPEILDVVPSGNRQVELVTQAYGILNRERNEVVELILEGNVSNKYIDLRGKLQDINASLPYRKQYFQLKPKDPAKPFVFNVVAIDKFGRQSVPRRVVAD